MENTKTPKYGIIDPVEVKKRVQQRLEQDKGKSLDEIYHDDSDDRLYNYYLKVEAGDKWNR